MNSCISMNRLRTFISHYLQFSIVRYFIMSACLVILELASFAFLNSVLEVNYLLATPASLIIVIFLNWYLGRIFVFTQSKYKPHHEFTLVVLASIIGIGIQTGVAAFCVEIVGLVPFIAKIFAIGVTFFWNFFIRQKYIFR